jgi:hypothetical protein
MRDRLPIRIRTTPDDDHPSGAVAFVLLVLTAMALLKWLAT